MLNQKLKWFNLTKRELTSIILGAIIMSFTLVNVHVPARITEGGILGLALIGFKVFDFNPSIITPTLDFLCIAFGFSLFGKTFLKKTAIASIFFALFYKIFSLLGPVLPNMYNYPVLAAVVGGIGIGIGCGLVISQGGAAGGDDALALIMARRLGFNISVAYLITDVIVLMLSLSYIPFGRIIFSLITTIVSSFLVGQFEIQIKAPVDNKSVSI